MKYPANRFLLRCLQLACISLLWASNPGAVYAEDCRPGHALSEADLAQLDLDAYREARESRLPSGNAYTVGQIHIFRQNVFPNRDYMLARAANRFNIVTKEYAVRAALPIEPADQVDENRLGEVERVLRRKPFLYDAVVLVRRTCGEVIDLDVVVRDVWTLNPNVGIARSGGDNEFNLGFSDVNIIGSGKSLSFEYFDDRDRSGAVVEYEDPNILSTRWSGRALLSDNDDGRRYRLDINRPFFALDTAYAVGLSFDHFVREEDLELLGRDQFELDTETDRASAFWAFSKGRQQGWVNRWFVGARYFKEQVDFPIDFPDIQEQERTFLYPFIAWESIQDEFAKRIKVDRVGITEDIKLGWSSYVELGYSSDSFGGDGDFLLGVARGDYRRYINNRHLLTVSGRFNGRYEVSESRSEDVFATLNINYLWKQAAQWRLLTRLSATHTENLLPNRQLTLGGDSGLRGYPSRYQPGDQRVLFTLEQRYHSNVYPFGLFRLGYAVFVDAGRARFSDDPPPWLPPLTGREFGNLANVGFGLRLESTRTRRDRVLHIDFAKPLVDGPRVDSLEITISAKRSF